MRALITGVRGFAGSHLAEHLLDAGDEVLGASRQDAWPDEAPATLASLPLVAWDLASVEGPDGAARRRIEQFAPTAIYHLGALSVREDCGTDEPTPTAWQVNVEGTGRVVELAARLPSRPRVLLVSSSRVYAPVDEDAAWVDEGAPLGPTSAYGKTKQAAEELATRRSGELGVELIVARAFQHAGPRQDPRLMLAEWARQFAVGGEQPVRVQTLDAWIDLSDVRDVVRAYRLLLERGSAGKKYNIGSGVARRSGDVLQRLRELADPGRPIIELRPGRKQDPIADCRRLKECTGWRPQVPLEQTLLDTLEDWRQRVSCSRTKPVR